MPRMTSKPAQSSLIASPHRSGRVCPPVGSGMASSCRGCGAASGNRRFCAGEFPPRHTAAGLQSPARRALALACGHPAMGALFPAGCPAWGHYGLHHDPSVKSRLTGRQQLPVSGGGSTALSRVVPYRERCSNAMWEWRKAAENLVRLTLLPERAPLPSVQSAISSKIAQPCQDLDTLCVAAVLRSNSLQAREPGRDWGCVCGQHY